MAVRIHMVGEPAAIRQGLWSGTPQTVDVDAVRLERALHGAVRGEVRFSAGDRGMYASDAGNYRQVPLGVILPRDADDVMQAVSICRQYGVPVHGRGGGTGIPGQTVNSGVVFDFSKYMHALVELDPARKRARVQPGIVLDTLRDAAEVHDLTFGPDPATHTRCTLGGMIGNNSCGIHSVWSGRTSDNIADLDILTYDGVRMRVGPTGEADLARIIAAGGRRGEIYRGLRDLRDKYADLIRQRFPRIPRRVSGYNLNELLPENGFNVARALVGSEGTCAFVLEATVQLLESPQVRSLLVLGYPDIYAAADHVVDVLPARPLALEALDHEFIDDMKRKGMHPRNIDLMPEGRGWLLVEFGGRTKEEADASARQLMQQLAKRPGPPPMKLFDDPGQERLVWHLREAGLGATARVPGEPDNHEGWEDSAVAPDKVGPYLRDLKGLMDRYGYTGALYGHFGDGCVHTRLTFDLLSAEGVQAFRSFLQEAAELVTRYGGSLSGEHGDGQARGELLPTMFGDELVQAFREFKAIWDPGWKMNPGKVVDPYRVDQNLRLGPTYDPPNPKTHFQFPDDKHSFAYAADRCVGAGVCRRKHGGVMCPSYMVTLEEKHSTRGRARLLYEMVRGETIKEGWKSGAVKEALDLCLACKGCKGDCPVQVDMATYKAEFLSHYYEGRPRPMAALAMGRIHVWAQLASLAPGLVNLVTQAPGLSSAAKWVAGIHPSRRMPQFAPQTFRQWFRRRGPRNEGKPEVILWADTFNNHFHPATARAAVEVLEAAGFHVEVPEQNLCCGRPLYDWGMLDTAKARLREILSALKQPIEDGTPVVVLEPSCASVFRDELTNLFPNDADAARLQKQTLLLSEFLRQHAPGFQPARLGRKALVQGHCHHQAVLKMEAEEQVLGSLGLDYHVLDSGCCGMAGAFGFERDHYDVSMACGERALLPAVRQAGTEDLIVANGFSCREQIAQSTGRQALHLAEVLQLALHDGGQLPAQANPEAPMVSAVEAELARSRSRAGAALAVGAVSAVGLALLWGVQRARARSR